MEDIIEIVKSLEDSGLLFKGVTETVQIEVKEQKGGFVSRLLGTTGASLLKNILSGQCMNRAGMIQRIKSWRRNCKSGLWLSFFKLLCFAK